MKPREITAVALKVFSIYILVNAIQAIPFVINSLTWLIQGRVAAGGYETPLYWLLGAASFVALVSLAVLTWKLGGSVVRQAATGDDNDTNNPVITEAFLLSLLGIYLTVIGLRGVWYSTWNIVALAQNNTELDIRNTWSMFGDLFQVLVGVSLMVKATAWSRLLRWLREAGLREKV
ncbi:MAG: hypothetical protein AAGI67_16410 [Pseudomonadota bacterium]